MKFYFLSLIFLISLGNTHAMPMRKNEFQKPKEINNKTKTYTNSNLINYDKVFKNNDKLDNYLTFSTGTFVRGLWGPKYIASKCTVWELCYEKLEGVNIGTNLTKEIYKKNSFSLDIDTGLMLAAHDTNKNVKNNEINSGDKFYLNISFIPMIRIKRISNKFPLGLGYGAGLSYILGKPKIEQPYDTPLLSEVKAELSYPINKFKESEIVFGLHHRCTLLGLLTPKDGTSFGQHWYSVGFRYKL